MYCRLPQQISSNKEDGGAVNRESHCNNKGHICRTWIPCRSMSDTGTNFVSDKFKKFCSRLNIKQAVSSAYHHQSNGQVKACIKFIKHTLKGCVDSSGDIDMALFQIHTTPLEQGLLNPATLLFNYPVHGVMPVIDRKPISGDNDDEYHIKLVHRQHKNNPNNDASQVLASIFL